ISALLPIAWPTAASSTHSLFASGSFTSIARVPARYLARWDGQHWSELPGAPLSVNALAWHDADGAGPQPAQLYAAGSFATIGGVPANNVARLDGLAWQPFGSGLLGPTYAICSFDRDHSGPLPPDLYVGGTVPALARWNGTSWDSTGPLGGQV